MTRESMLQAVADLVRQANAEIMDVYAREDFGVETKEDDSPLTQADLRAHRVLEAGLRALTPELPVISEESGLASYEERRTWARYWLIDPLDGTKEFIARNGEFTVNVALIEDGQPTLGCVGVPARDALYLGDVLAGMATCIDARGTRALRARPMQAGRAVAAVASRRHGGERLEVMLKAMEADFGTVELKNVGSALKLCLIAEGEADIYPRLGPTSEWDIAAAQAVLQAAGGAVTQLDGSAIEYNKRDILNPEFLAVADPAYGWAARLPRV
jgi:3'(2'), 5'-bisphosphate nucleotidase